MTSMTINRQLAKGHQQGAIMIICLVILFSMTLIGISSMDSAVLELKMSNTMQQQVVALNRAESTLQAAEIRIETMTADGVVHNFEAADDGFYPKVNTIEIGQADWSDFDTEDGPISTDNSVDDDDSYVVEYLGAKPIPGETVAIDTNGAIAGGAVFTFRNTTRSAAGRSVVRIIQSVYVTLSPP